MPSRRALVTGATGFVGSRLAGALARAGWQVHAVARPSSNLGELERIAGGGHVLHVYDGSARAMSRIVAQAAPEVTFHVAAAGGRPDDRADDLVDGNVRVGVHLLEALREVPGALLVNTATHWQYHGGRERAASSLYAACKQAVQDLVQFYCDAWDLRAITLVLYDTYGEADPRPRLLALLAEALRTGRALDMTPGAQEIDLLHVDDVAGAYSVAAARLLDARDAEAHRVYAVRSGAPLRLREVVERFGVAAGAPVPVNWGALPYRRREAMAPWRGGETLPGWAPRIPLAEGLARLAAWPGAAAVAALARAQARMPSVLASRPSSEAGSRSAAHARSK